MRPNRGRISLLAAWLVFVPVISLAQDESGEDTDKLPPPSSWKPAGEVTGPAPTAGAGEASAVPGPMFSYGGFELDLKGRIQVMAGMVGDDAHTSNGDLLSRDGFRIRRARLGVAGQLIERWEYGLELDLIDEDSGGNALLDAFVTWRACERAWIQAGAGKLPFSRVVMVSSADMQFIERPVWVNAEAATGTAMLDPGRQVGITAGGQVGLFSYMAGVYNGSPGFSKGDLNDGLMYALRLGLGQGELGTSEADFQRGGLRWAFGLNGYLNQAQSSEIRAAGADLGIKFEGLSLYVEALWAKSIPDTRPEGIDASLDEAETWGMVAQAGYLIPLDFADLEVACRFAIMDDNVHVDNEGDLWELTAGINAYLLEHRLKAMLNYVLKEERQGADLSNDAVVLMLQLAF